VELIENIAALSSIEPEWNALLSRSGADTIFLTWEWVRSWFESVERSVIPFVITVRDEKGRLKGIAPFYTAKYLFLRSVPVKFLRVVADHASGMDYPDWIVDREDENITCASIAEALIDHSDRWDCIWMGNVAGWTGAPERITGACKNAGLYCHTRNKTFAFIKLPESMESYMRMLSKNRHQQLARQERKVFGRGGISITRCREISQLPRFLDALVELHIRRRRKQGQKGVFERKPNELRFYKAFTPVALKLGWLRLYGLEESGKLKAVQIGYVYNNTYFQMQEGFDPDYVQGVGNVLRVKVIEGCIQEALGGYDFLGEMTEHKRRWEASQRMGFDIMIGRRNLINRIIFGLNVWPTGRYLVPVDLPHGLKS